MSEVTRLSGVVDVDTAAGERGLDRIEKKFVDTAAAAAGLSPKVDGVGTAISETDALVKDAITAFNDLTSQLNAQQVVANQLALAQHQLEAQAGSLALAEEKLAKNTDPAAHHELTGAVLQARTALDRQQITVDELAREYLSLDGATDKARDGMKQTQSTATSLNNVLGQFGLALSVAAVGSAMAEMSGRAVELAAKMEGNKIAFETLTGSTRTATQHLEALRDFAAGTPFEFTDLVEASKKMHALGFETERVIPTLTVLGDAASGLSLGKEGIDRMVLALGQMQAKGKASGEELLQLTESGIPALRYLAESAGVTQGQMSKMVEKGLVPASEAIDAILAGAEKDFGGLMSKQANTATTAFSNLKDVTDRILTGMGEGMNNVLGPAAAATAHYLSVYAELDEAWRSGSMTQAEALGLLADYTTGLQTEEMVLRRVNDAQNEYIHYKRESGKANQEAASNLSAEERAVAAYGARWAGIGAAFEPAMEASKEAQEYFKKVQEEADKAQKAESEAWLERFNQSLVGNPVQQENENYASSMTDLESKAADLRAEIDKLTESNGKYYETIQGNGATTAQIELANQKLAAAYEKLSKETDPLKIAQLNVEIEKQQGIISGADQVVGGYIDNSKKITELEADYQVVEDAINDVKKAHQQATAQIVLDILTQKLMTTEFGDHKETLSAEEKTTLENAARQWGIYEGSTIQVIQNVDKSLTEHGLNAAQIVTDLGNKIAGLPSTKEIEINVRTHYQAIHDGDTQIGAEPEDPAPNPDLTPDPDPIVDPDPLPDQPGSVNLDTPGSAGGLGQVVIQIYETGSPQETANAVIAILQDRGLVDRNLVT